MGTTHAPAAPPTTHLIVKTIAACVVVIASNVAGNYALKRGLSHTGVGPTWSPMPYIHAFSHVWVDVGVVFMATWFLSRLALLSWADLSYVLPVCSFSYVLSAVAGAVLLGERIPWVHWLGTCLITLGVAVTAFTVPETTPQPGEFQ